MFKKSMCLVFLFIFSTLGCGKDKTTEDYQQDQDEKNLAKYQAVEGSYSGHLIANRNQQNLGALRVKLTASTRVQGSTEQSVNRAQPILVADLEFLGFSKMSIVAENSLYNSETGQFQADIPVPKSALNLGSSSESIKLKMTGTLGSGILEGTLEALGYSEFGSRFRLSNTNPSLESLNEKVKPTNNLPDSELGYTGTTNFKSGEIEPVEIVLLKTPVPAESEFVNMFVPLRQTIVSLNYGGGTSLTFSNSSLDQRSGILIGSTNLSSGLTLSMSCQLASDLSDLACKVSNSAVQGPIATLVTKLSTPENQIPENMIGSQNVVKTYQGIAKVAPEKVLPVTLVVTDPAKSRFDFIMGLYEPQIEKQLQLSLVINPNATESTLGLSNVRWDKSRKTLYINQNVPVSGQIATVSLSCQNFDLSAEQFNFTCNYQSSLRNYTIEMSFISP